MTEVEKLLILNARQTVDLASMSATSLGLIRQLAETTAALEQATQTIKVQQSTIELLTGDLAEARVGVGK